MAGGDEAIAALRAALSVSPDNIPLRKHLADTLAGYGRWGEAETEFRAALALSPDNDDLKLGLAGAFYQQGKYSASLVILESRLSGKNVPARMLLLHARLLLRSGEAERAVSQYCAAREADPALEDSELAEQLGMDREETEESDSWEVVEGKLREAEEDDSRKHSFELERPKINFQEVGGMEDLKEEIRMKIIHPMSHPQLYAAYGKKVGGGILMYGPPGCGKTYLARATAGEVRAKFLAIGISDVLDMWIGNSERNLHAIFDEARKNKPCVLFFDEVDALGASRSDLKLGAARLINQFLSEMDGVEASNEGVLILAATNAPWHLDSAFRRPGRFDRILFVPPPDAVARAQILRLMLTGKPCQDIHVEEIAKKTDGFSGADLKAVVDVAVEHKLREAFKSGAPMPLTTKDLLAAVKGLKPTTREWFATARNYALYSNQGGIYDDILKHLKLYMTAHLDRAMLLVEQSRFEMAERELHLVLADQPGLSLAHSLLAICLVERKAFTEATVAAQTAIGCGPDEPFPYYTLARVLFARNEFEESAKAIGEALALDPFQPQFHSQLAAVRLEQRRWPEALASAEQGLALEPDHIGCANLRAIALVRLGRRIEAQATLSNALSHDPNNALSHANVGWTMLEARQYEQAMNHFREALRLDAECEWARVGIVEALKARHFIYGWLLRYFLWTTRLTRTAHVAIVVLGLVFLNLANVGLQQLPGGTWLAVALIGAYGSFAYLTWAGEALFNLVLRFDKLGRYALSDEEKRISNHVGICLAMGLLSLAIWPIAGGLAAVAGVVIFSVLVIPVAGSARCPEGWPREVMEAFTLGLGILGLACLAMLAASAGENTFWGLLGEWLFIAYCLSIVASTWLASGLAAVRVRH